MVQMYMDDPLSIKQGTEATSLPLLGIAVHDYMYLLYLRSGLLLSLMFYY